MFLSTKSIFTSTSLAEKKTLPFDINGAIISYAGPTPSPQHLPIGSCGPTTSGRMDIYTPDLLDLGLTAMYTTHQTGIHNTIFRLSN